MKKLLTLAALVAAFSLLIATWPAEPARAAAGFRPGMMHELMLPQTAASVATGFTADRLNKFTSSPGCPVAGYLYYDTTADTVKACNNALTAAVIGTSLPDLTDSSGVSVTSGVPFILPDTAGSGVPSLKGATAATGVYLNGTIAGLVSTTNGWIGVGNTAATAAQLPVNGILGWSSSGVIGGAGNQTFVRSRGAANITFGAADINGVPVAQILSFQNAITGTDLPGSSFTIDAPKGTGAGAGTKTCLNRALMGATGTTAQSTTNGLCVGESKTLSNSTAQTTALVNISVPSNSSGGSSGSINVSCNDGTNFDSETVTFFVSYVNKATALTIGTVQLGTPSTANNSGSCTTAVTATAGTNSVNINVTPVITTIVPTTTTGTVLSLSSYATGNVTIN